MHNEPPKGIACHSKKPRLSPADAHASLFPVSQHVRDDEPNFLCNSPHGVVKDLTTSPFILEICAGSARVTSCLQGLGLTASFGVDHKRQKHAGKIMVADLTSVEGQTLCWSWIKSPNCMGIFCAPPCGTCSKARGIPVVLPNGCRIAGPQPLRSEEFPDGVQSMSYLNRRRVWSANTLYKFVTDVALYALDAGMIVVIENPRSSLYWRTSFFSPLRKRLTFTAHQACAYGSDRPKWTVLAHNTKSLLHLCKTCPGLSKTHHHKPWGVVPDPNNSFAFSTAEETAYPLPLAYAIAFSIALEVIRRGWEPPAQEFIRPDDVSYHYLRAIVGVQPKASKIPPILSEYSHVESVPVPSEGLPIAFGQHLKAAFQSVPAGSKLLKQPPLRLNGGLNNPGVNKFGDSPGDKLTMDVDEEKLKPSDLAHFGVYRTGEQFVKAAVKAGHPIGKDTKLPAPLQEAVNFVASHSSYEVAKSRHSTLVYWLDRAKSLQDEEKRLHSNLPVSMQGILAPKRLMLWKDMMSYYGYPDCEVFDEVVAGIDLAGPVIPVKSFDPCFKPAKVSVAELSRSSKASRVAMLSTIRSSGDGELDESVFAKTMEELECGWLEGPIDPCDLPDGSVVSRRFGIKQASGDSWKVRLIDDFSASGVNDTVQVETATKLHTLDIAAALCMELMKVSGDCQWMGKTIDLSAAYRQLGVAPSSKWVSFIAVYDPRDDKPKVFAMRALPFGASKSVYSFLRVAHSLWWLGCKALHFTWSNFFDDFITFAKATEAELVSGVALQFFNLLGWAVSLGDKNLPFCEKFKALGVEVDCSNWLAGKVLFANTEKRVKELAETLDATIKKGRLSKQEALVQRGRMQFAKAQMWGRSAKICLAAVTAHAYSGGGPVISDHVMGSLATFRACLVEVRPREITSSWDVPLYVFTDASFSPESDVWPGGLGGVLVDHSGNYVSAFSFKLKGSDLAALGYPTKSTVIFEAEMLALLVAMTLWKKHLRNHPVVLYVDNNSTRDVCISGGARTSPGKELITKILMLEDELSLIAWYARVPSLSNISDGPSRGSTDEVPAKFLSPDLVEIAVSRLLHDVANRDQGMYPVCG